MEEFDDLTASGAPKHRREQPLSPGRQIAHYRVERLLGAGGMGHVYLAEDLRLHRQVALKAQSPHVAADPEFRDRFQSEARSAARLSHPGITTIYAFEMIDDLLLIAMEYVEGATLKQLIRKGPLAPDLVADIAMQCGDALAEAHRQKIIHRDIKSSNILLTSEGRAKVTDFGLAKVIVDDDMTASAATVGTFQYMSPEQILGHDIDFRTDLFSLGVVLYELLAGRLPFEGRTAAEVARSLTSAPVPSLPSPADIPVPLQQVVYRCLQRDLHARFQNASEIVATLSGVPIQRPVVPAASRHQVALAVFPLTDVDPDASSHYYADSLTEEIIVRLSKIRALRIASRTSVYRFSTENQDLIATATRLGVDAFLSGRLRRIDDRVRLSVELARTQDGSVIWSDVLLRDPEELQDVQLEIVQRVTEALDIQLSAREERTVVRKYTDHLEAYDLYLRGKFHARQRDRDSLMRAAAYYEQALAFDPGFIEAKASLSVVQALLFVYGHDPSPARAERALELALAAVQERQNSAESHLALGTIYRQNNILKGIRELEQAVSLDPTNTEAQHFLANSYVIHGQYPAAIAQEEKALELDPEYVVSLAHLCRIHTYLDNHDAYEKTLARLRKTAALHPLIAATLGWRFWLQGEWDAAVTELERVIRQEPRAFFSRIYLADSLIRTGRLDRAGAVVNEGLAHGQEHFTLAQCLGSIALENGDSAAAEREFDRSEELLRRSAYGWIQERSPLFHSQMGVLELRRGRIDKALEHVRIAVGEGYGHYAGLEKDPPWQPLRVLASFVDLTAAVRRRCMRADTDV